MDKNKRNLIELCEELKDIIVPSVESPFNRMLQTKLKEPQFGVDSISCGYTHYEGLQLEGRKCLIKPKTLYEFDYLTRLSRYNLKQFTRIHVRVAGDINVNTLEQKGDYLNRALSFDFLSLLGGIRAFHSNKAFVADKDESVINSNLFKNFNHSLGVKTMLVFFVPLDKEHKNEQWVWLTFYPPKNQLFSDEQIMNLETLWYTNGLRNIFARTIKGSFSALTRPLTSSLHQTALELSAGKKVAQNRITALTKALGSEEEEKKAKYNTIHIIQALSPPFLSWFDQHVFKPEGDPSLLKKY